MFRREIEKYLSNEVQWASPGELVVTLYDVAIRSLDTVLRSDIPTTEALRKQELGRVVGILIELEAALDPSKGEELAQVLARMYRSLRTRIVEASTLGGSLALQDVRDYLDELRSAWVVVAAEADRPRVAYMVDKRRRRS